MTVSRRMLRALTTGVMVALAPIAVADYAQFEAEVDGTVHTANVPIEPLYGVDYVPLSRIVDQFGGAFRVVARRMRVDFKGARAWVQVDDKRVSALSVFSLRQPIRRKNDDFLIAHVDVEDFFEKGFRVSVRTPAEPVRRGVVERDTEEPEETAEIETLDGSSVRREQRTGRHTVGLRPLPPRDRPIEVIVIDPGHGGRDLGVEGGEGVLEKDVTLAVATALRDALAGRVEARVVLTREEDLELSLKQRAMIAGKHEGDLVITVHVGGSPSPQARGAAIFHPPAEEESRQRFSITSARLQPRERYRNAGAQSRDVAERLAEAFEAVETLAFRGVYEAPCRLLSHVGTPGVLVEVGCLTNPREAALLQEDEQIQQIATHLANGIAGYLGGSNGSADGFEVVEPSGEEGGNP